MNADGNADAPASAAQATNRLTSTYWLGLEYNSEELLWLWQDGEDAGNGEVLNAYPYAHW